MDAWVLLLLIMILFVLFVKLVRASKWIPMEIVFALLVLWETPLMMFVRKFVAMDMLLKTNVMMEILPTRMVVLIYAKLVLGSNVKWLKTALFANINYHLNSQYSK